MNMDWSLCEALQTTNLDGITNVLLIYDVMCQYHVNLYERVAASTKMSLPDTIRIIKAIGQFHVHGHQEECLYRFSTTFIPGVGVVDGEILETLWSTLNEVSRSTRTASLAHRTEILDDHMRDSNWKKIINTGEFQIYILQFYTCIHCTHKVILLQKNIQERLHNKLKAPNILKISPGQPILLMLPHGNKKLRMPRPNGRMT